MASPLHDDVRLSSGQDTVVQVVSPGKATIMANQANSLSHAKRMRELHIVSAPKHGRRVVYNQYRDSLGEVFRQLCGCKGVEIIEGRLMTDHVRMLVSMPPKLAVSSFMGRLKGKGALMMFDKHANLKCEFGNRRFWSEAATSRPSG